MNLFRLLVRIFLGYSASVLWYYHQISWQQGVLFASIYFLAEMAFSCRIPLMHAGRNLGISVASFVLGTALVHYHTQQYYHQLHLLKIPISLSAIVQDCVTTTNKKYPCMLWVTYEGNTMHCFMPETLSCSPGDTLHIRSATYHVPNKSFQRYLQKEGVLASWFLKKQHYTLSVSPKTSIKKWFFILRTKITRGLKAKLHPTTYDLCMLIFFGQKLHTPLTKKVQTEFGWWGTCHQLARSGLHVVLFITTWGFLINMLPFSFIIRNSILLAIVAFYYAISWPGIAFIRACIMIFLYILLKIIKIPIYPLYILVLACFLILLSSPLQLFFLDFQLSFLLTAAILFFYHPTHNKLKNH